ncbi:MAG TPA: hypothetical protein VK842_09905 [bacterium]|nr:hypothetical protein [bacterium]
MEKRQTERRKVNVAVGPERRDRQPDRRRCPVCGSSVRSSREGAPGGTLLKRYCTKCGWQASSRQVDEARLKALTGFEMTVHSAGRKAVLELEEQFMKAAGLKAGDTVQLQAVYAPGKKGMPLSWVMTKLD